MPHYEAVMSSKGQVTIPSKVRDFFDLKEGDRIDFYIDERSGDVRIIARNKKLSGLVGMLSKQTAMPDTAPSLQELDDAIGDYLGEKHDRISREWNERHEFEEWKRNKAAAE